MVQPLQVAILEDEPDLREGVLLPGLRDYGFAVVGAGSAAEFYRAILGRALDMVVLDVGLPDESGISVAGHLRRLFPKLGIVMLTANRARQDHVDAITEGADVFLSKPVDVEILALTLHSLARRLGHADVRADNSTQTAPPGWRLQADGWCLVAPSGAVVPLVASERSVLRQLDAAAGAVVERTRLIATLTDDVDGFDPHRLDMLIHRLRRKSADASRASDPPLPLLSERGRGYRLGSG